MPLDLPSYDNLNSMFLAPYAAQQAEKNNGLREMFAQGEMQKQQQDLSNTAAMNPLRQQQLSLSNQMTEAQIPGIRAQSSQAEDKANISRSTLQQQLEDALAKHGSSVSKENLDKLSNIGQIYSQAGEYISRFPGPGGSLISHATAKQLLGPYWNEEFSRINPNNLGAYLTDLGSSMGAASSKFQQELAKAQMKGDMSYQQAIEVAKIRADAQEAAAKARAAAQKKPAETMSQYEARIRSAANEGDPHAAEQLARLEQQRIQERISAAQIPDTLKRELLGMESNPTPVTPKPAGPKTPATLAEVQKMYPGVPEDKLRDAYKKKFGVDLK